MAAETPTLPEVPLYWSEFVSSLDKLRHRPYSRKMTEKDWYRINPLEMVLLGCQTLANHSSASRDHGTFVMTMKDLTEEMSRLPRYWQRIMDVLSQTIKGKDAPGLIVQRCAAGIVNLWNSASVNEKLRPGFLSWSIVHFKILELIDFLLTEKKKHLSPATNQDLSGITLEIQEIISNALVILESSLSPDSEAISREFSSDDTPTLIQLFLSILTNTRQLLDLTPPTETTPNSFSIKSSFLIQLACLKTSQSQVSLNTDISVPSKVADEIVKLSSFLTSCPDQYDSCMRLVMTITTLLVSMDADCSDDVTCLFAVLTEFFNNLCQQLKEYSPIVLKLLELVQTILYSKPLMESLPMAKNFVQNYVSVLLTYSREGYLSDNPVEFFLQLLEFVTCLAEHSTPPDTAIQVNLSNLFGSFFGVNSHQVSCRLLQYGNLSICSQHGKSLLTEGMQHIVKLWRLFPPIDMVYAREKTALMRINSLRIAEEILDEILTLLFAGSDEESHDQSHDQSNDTNDQSHDPADQSHDITNQSHEELESKVVEPTEAERVRDKDLRTLVLVHLLDLACAMVRNGDNINFLFASILPRLFSSAPPPFIENRDKLMRFFGEEPPARSTSLSWRVDKKQLAVCLLSLSVLSLENEMSTPFELCGIVMPKLARNLDSMSFTDQEKVMLSIDILNMTKDVLEAGHDIESFICHGLELLSSLLPQSVSSDDLKAFIQQLVQQLVSSGQTSSVLFFIRNACVYLKTFYPEESESIQKFFHTLVFKGKRNEIRSVFKICRDPFNDELYVKLRIHLYKFGQGQLTGRQLLALCEIIIAIMDLTKTTSEAKTPLEEEQLEDEEKLKREEEKQKTLEVMKRLIQPCISDVDHSITDGRFKKETWESKLAELSRLTLFRTLFHEELGSFYDLSRDDLHSVFESKFPREVLQSREAMDLLSLCATRIEHIQVPRYSALKTLLTGLIRQYLTVPDLSAISDMELLKEREQYLNDKILSLTRNVSDFNNFTLNCSYSQHLWDKPFSLSVTTDGSHSLEENMRQTLLACYTEFITILKEMGITHVSVNGELMKSVDLFSEDLSLAELKGHRSVAVRAIDQKLGGTKEGRIHERKVALLTQEDDIESDFEKQSKTPIKPKKFNVSLNIKFFDCVKCCGSQIIGCYAPTGEHCERPLEIGLRVDSGFLSLYDEQGIELENCEILLCEEGLYLFKAYTNGHPYDTSQVWIQIFTKLLEVSPGGSPAPLVPAIIIPRNFPNQRTWDLLRRSVQTEMTGSILTCQHDFSAEWRTYYDHRPEKVRCGVDMILQPGFTLSGPSHRPLFTRQRSRITKDLAGMMFDQIMSRLLEDNNLKQLRFLGKYVSQYISTLIEQGEERSSIISEGFDYDRWIRTQGGRGQGQAPPKSKEELVGRLVGFVNQQVMEWCLEADVDEMCEQSHKQLLQMRSFLGRWDSSKHPGLAKKYLRVKEVLIQSTVIVPISLLPRATQEELIHWIFQNEDRVWRYRGGRCGHETLQQFLSFLGSSVSNDSVYSGVAVFSLPAKKGLEVNLEEDIKVEKVVGYSVGEIVSPASERGQVENENNEAGQLMVSPGSSCYEVAIGWVNPKYQKLSLSVHMYFSIMRNAPSRYIMCDMVQGSVDRIIQSNPLLRLLHFLRASKYIIRKRQQSYSVQLQTGDSEQFEQVVFLVWPMRLSLWLYGLVTKVFRWRQPSALPRIIN